MSDQSTNLRSLLLFNVAGLGGLYLALLMVAVEGGRYRITSGSFLFGPLGIWLGVIYVALLGISFLAWVFCIKRTWEITEGNSSARAAWMAYLVGAIPLLYQVSPEIVVGILTWDGTWVPVK